MLLIADAHDVQYGLVEPVDVAEMVELLADVFSRFEPPAVAAGLTIDELRGIVSLFGQRATEDALTIVARAVTSGRLIGAMLTEDFASAPPEGIDEIADHFHPIAAMLDGLDAQFRERNRILPGQILHLYMLGVAEGFGGRGIARNLIRLALENGRRKGYRKAVTEATGNVSQHIFRGLGFEERFRTAYKEFSYHGRRSFDAILEHEAVILMEKNLDSPL